MAPSAVFAQDKKILLLYEDTSSTPDEDASPRQDDDASPELITRTRSTRPGSPYDVSTYPRAFVPRAPHRAKFHPPYRCLQTWNETHSDSPDIEILRELRIGHSFLMNLPDELKIMIFENITRKKSLNSVSLVCRRFHVLVYPLLFKTLNLRVGMAFSCSKLVLEHCSQLSRYARRLRIASDASYSSIDELDTQAMELVAMIPQDRLQEFSWKVYYDRTYDHEMSLENLILLFQSHSLLRKVCVPTIRSKPENISIPVETTIRGLSALSYLDISIHRAVCLKIWEQIFAKIGRPCLLSISWCSHSWGVEASELYEIFHSLGSFSHSISISLVRLNLTSVLVEPEFVPALQKWRFPCLKALDFHTCSNGHIILSSLKQLPSLSAFAFRNSYSSRHPEISRSLSEFLLSARGLQEIKLQVPYFQLPTTRALTFHAPTLCTLAILEAPDGLLSRTYTIKQQTEIYTKCTLLRHLSISVRSFYKCRRPETIFLHQPFLIPTHVESLAKSLTSLSIHVLVADRQWPTLDERSSLERERENIVETLVFEIFSNPGKAKDLLLRLAVIYDYGTIMSPVWDSRRYVRIQGSDISGLSSVDWQEALEDRDSQWSDYCFAEDPEWICL